ncbi:hypothetical protein BD410DRAFT_155823 [Rickenella mellea]|uniref:Mixed lineage kinase domain-containing protein n=1 Tax=Rickenella mellea TaxID=50990 RepID=A0A4Y7PIR1_9AGAM|nr:hypothetical protein BD410DRAFT_155823 [Rickenella mellea]
MYSSTGVYCGPMPRASNRMPCPSIQPQAHNRCTACHLPISIHHHHHHHQPMPFRRRLSRHANSKNESDDAQGKEPGSSSVAAAAAATARAATPVALRALAQSTDIFPPLKSAVSFLLQVHDICEKMKSYREGAGELRVRVEGVRSLTAEAFEDEEDICMELYDALVQFDDALNSILAAVDDVRWRKSRLVRLAYSAKDADTLRIVKQRLDDAMRLLMLIVTLYQSKTLHSMSQPLDTTVMSVSRVEVRSSHLFMAVFVFLLYRGSRDLC